MPAAPATRHAFVGRETELAQLERTARLAKAGLVVCSGRMRIGKTALIRRFAQSYGHFYEFQGLPPREQTARSHQLEHFTRQMSEQLRVPLARPQSWYEAFVLLARLMQGQRALIHLDEISWMACQDEDFVGQLKIAWDTRLKQNRGLILVLGGCGSAWIREHILDGTALMGRVSLSLALRELPLDKCNELFGALGGAAGQRMSTLEKVRLLCVTGGIPRYLEEIDYTATAERNITAMCFTSGGLLVDEFDKIFNDIFSSRAPTYRQIVSALVDGARTAAEICAQLGVAPSGIFTEYLEDLQAAGFVQRDYVYSLATADRASFSRYRLKDNYLRFYLKYVEPVRHRVETGTLNPDDIPPFAAFDAIVGLQLENLVLNNIPLVLKTLNIRHVRSASPYFQHQTLRQKACQIDLLIDTQHAVYLCEIKRSSRLKSSIVDEISEKARRLKIDRGKSLRRVLIYAGELDPGIEVSGALDQIVPFERFLHPPSQTA